MNISPNYSTEQWSDLDFSNEQFWRTLKYEEVYMKAYDSVWECKKSIGEFMEKYNARRLHQSLGEYDTPLEAYR